MKIYIISLVFIILLTYFETFSLSAQQVTFTASAPEYAGIEIIFYKTPEPITHKAVQIGSSFVSSDGRFSFTFQEKNTIEIYADLGKYRGSMVVQPGHSYQISFPPFSQKTVDEARSPFFEPLLYWFGLENTTEFDLNTPIREFTIAFNKELSDHSTDIYLKKSSDSVKMIVLGLEKKFPDRKDSFFNILKKYSYAELELLVSQKREVQMPLRLFGKEPVSMAHPQYQKIFTSLFSDFLTKDTQGISRNNYRKFVFAGDFKGLVDMLVKTGYSGGIAEWIMVKALYDCYFTDKYPKESILNALKNAQKQVSTEELSVTLNKVLQSISILQKGTLAPQLILFNSTKGEIKLNEIKGKFIYLAFFRSDSKDCRMELDSMVSIAKRAKNVMTVVAVTLDEQFDATEKLWKEKNYPWDFWKIKNTKEGIANYQLNALPTFYLIAPDHTLLLSPSLQPTHDFESLFLKILRDNHSKYSKWIDSGVNLRK